jgi:hypothetical protein
MGNVGKEETRARLARVKWENFLFLSQFDLPYSSKHHLQSTAQTNTPVWCLEGESDFGWRQGEHCNVQRQQASKAK